MRNTRKKLVRLRLDPSKNMEYDYKDSVRILKFGNESKPCSGLACESRFTFTLKISLRRIDIVETFASVMTSVDLTFVNRDCTVPSSVVISTLASVSMLLLQKASK